MVAAPAEDSDHEVNTGTRKAKARQKQKQFIRCDYTSQFVSETHYWVLSGRKTKPIRHPWENYSLFSLDSLYRCASAAARDTRPTGWNKITTKTSYRAVRSKRLFGAAA